MYFCTHFCSLRKTVSVHVMIVVSIVWHILLHILAQKHAEVNSNWPQCFLVVLSEQLSLQYVLNGNFLSTTPSSL